MIIPCPYCSDTGFEDWAAKQEISCPKGCKPVDPLTDNQRTAYLRRLELTGTRAHRKEIEDTDRHFTEMLFCGAGDTTRYDVGCLHGRIDRSLTYLSGRQQPPHWQEQPTQEMLDNEEAYIRKAHLVCEQIARDVAMALTGKEITFTE